MKDIVRSILNPLKKIVNRSKSLSDDEMKKEILEDYCSNESELKTNPEDGGLDKFYEEVEELKNLWESYQNLLLSYKKSEEELKKSHDQLKKDNFQLQSKIKSIGEEKSQILNDYDGLNKQFSIASDKIKKTNKIRYAKLDYSRFTQGTVNNYANESRKRNGKLNFTEIGKKLGVSDHTAKNICKHFDIK